MKKIILCLSMVAVCNFPAIAETTMPNEGTATTDETSQQPVSPAPTGLTDASQKAPTSPEPASTSQAPSASNQPIDCNYKLPAQITEVDTNFVIKWAEKAIEQSFTFENTKLDTQLDGLKACFTTQGWQSFHDALEKSGNLKAIASQQLVASAMVDGQALMRENKHNQWKVTIPLQVVYQNKQQKITQSLTVEVLVGRKLSGDLGIMQVVAQPRGSAETPSQPSTPESTSAPEPTQTSPAASPTEPAPAEPASTEPEKQS